MRFLFLSGSGESCGLAYRLQADGHEVICWIREGDAKRNYDGLLRKTSQWESHLRVGTIVVFDSVGGGKTADRLRGDGYRVIGGSVFADQVEFDWEVTREILRQRDLPLCAEPVGPLFAVDWWFKDEWIGNPLFSLKRTRLCNDDLGPRTSCMGVRVWSGGPHAAFHQLTGLLRHHQYEGPVSLTFDRHGRVVDWVLRLNFDVWCNYPYFLGCLQNKPRTLPPIVLHRVVQAGYGTHKKGLTTYPISTDPLTSYIVDCRKEGQIWTTGYRGNICSVPEELAWTLNLPDKIFRTDLDRVFELDHHILFERN